MELEMSWEASLLSQKRKVGGPIGLRNLGNSCYLNSVLQCLTYTPPLANFCLRKLHSSLCDSSGAERKRECPFCILEKRIVRSLCADLVLDSPMKIQSCLKIFSERFRCGRQEDAHEFLRYVIDACHNTCLRLKKLRRIGNGNGNGNGSANGNGGDVSVVKEIFGGALQSQVKCLSCGNESNKVDEIMDISLDVLHSNSLKDALRRFFQAEVLDGNNKYRCESCKKLVTARKQMSVLQAPNILVIQLKRFEGIFGGKIDKSIPFEEVLVLSSFMCKASKDPQAEYKLFGTIVHSGFSPESGHYYAYIKDAMGRWYCCNDSFVSHSTVQEVLSEKVYILFFCRTNQRRESANFPIASTLSNGVKSRDCNGYEASKSLKPDLPPRAVHTKSYEQPSKKDMIGSKADKVTSSAPVKLNIVGSSNSKGSLNGNGKVFKKQNMTANGGAKDTTCLEKIEKPKLTANQNGLSNNVKVNGQASISYSGHVSSNGVGGLSNNVKVNGQASVSHSGHESTNGVGGSKSEFTTGRGPDRPYMVNGGVDHAKKSGSKRKPLENSCILLAEDVQSREKVENMKENLKKEASSVLRSCGYSDKVCSFMRKRLRTQEAEATPLTIDELKKSLIGDAKSTFISQIPEALKGNLIKRIISFSQEK